MSRKKIVLVVVRQSTGPLTTTKLKTRTRAARCGYSPEYCTLQVVLHLGRIGRCQTDPILASGSVSREVLIALAEIDPVSAVGLLLRPQLRVARRDMPVDREPEVEVLR